MESGTKDESGRRPALAARIVRAIGRSVGRLRPEVVQAIDRAHPQFVNVVTLKDSQRNLAAGRAPAPEFAIELGLRVDRVASHRQDDVSGLHAGSLGRAVGRHARHQQTSLDFVGGYAEPGPSWTGAMTASDEIAHDRLDEI